MRDGVVGDFSVGEPAADRHRGPAYSRSGFLRARVIRRHCEELVDAFEVKTPDLDTPAHNLSSSAGTSRS